VSVLLFGAGSGTGIGPLSTSTPIVVGVGNLVVATADGPSGILDSLRVLVTQGSQTVVQPAAITLSETVLGDDESTYEARFVAPLTAGEFSISWSGPEDDQAASEPLITEIGVRPSMWDVGALLRSCRVAARSARSRTRRARRRRRSMC
jgi:hypothetical protein